MSIWDAERSRRGFLKDCLDTSWKIGVTAAYLELASIGLDQSEKVLINPVELLTFGPESLPYYLENISRQPRSRIIMAQIGHELESRRPASVKSLLQIGLDKAVDAQSPEPPRDALNCLAAICVLEKQKDLTGHLPIYIPDGRKENPGVDKTTHFVTNSLLAYELSKLADIQSDCILTRFVASAHAVNTLVGNDNLKFIADRLSKDQRRSFGFPPPMQHLYPREENIANLLLNLGISYEALSTIAAGQRYDDSVPMQRSKQWLLFRLAGDSQQIRQEISTALDVSSPLIYHGLGDCGVNNDLFAGVQGILMGLNLARYRDHYRTFMETYSISGDDYSSRFGVWQGVINKRGRTDSPPETYPRSS